MVASVGLEEIFSLSVLPSGGIPCYINGSMIGTVLCFYWICVFRIFHLTIVRFH